MAKAILDYIRSDSGKNFKVDALAQYKDNELLRELLQRTYSPLIRFGISLEQVPEHGVVADAECAGLEWALPEVDKLSSREITGNAAKQHIKDVLSKLSADNAEIIKQMLDGSLKLGCNVSSINKAIGRGFIKETPYMGAEPFTADAAKNLLKDGQAVLQLKCDGRYSNKAIEAGKVTIESRQGLPNYFGESFAPLAVFEELFGESLVLNGELLVRGVPDRYEANGMISSMDSIGEKIMLGEDIEKELAKFEKRFGASYHDKLNDLYYVVWDFIPMTVYTGSDTWEKPYHERMTLLQEMIDKADVGDKIEFVETHIVTSTEEAESIAAKWILDGYEGGILKKHDGEWKKGKRKATAIKYKLEMDFDLVITGGTEGKGKNKGLISSIRVETSCGQLVSNPAGISESDMVYITENLEQLVGDKTIVKVKCCGLSKDKKGNWSLLHPVFEHFRTDKGDADSLEQCQSAQQAFIELKASLGVETLSAGTVKVSEPVQQTFF